MLKFLHVCLRDKSIRAAALLTDTTMGKVFCETCKKEVVNIYSHKKSRKHMEKEAKMLEEDEETETDEDVAESRRKEQEHKEQEHKELAVE